MDTSVSTECVDLCSLKMLKKRCNYLFIFVYVWCFPKAHVFHEMNLNPPLCVIVNVKFYYTKMHTNESLCLRELGRMADVETIYS